jgi:GNAT superfamily N-acetyltransferase
MPQASRRKRMNRCPGSEVGDCIACVAARFYREAEYAEIKRLYVQEAYRGLGLSRKLMSAIEAEILA